MKFKLLYLLTLLFLIICGCSADLDYRKAVREQNFEKAHSILNRMEDNLNDFYENNEMVQERVFDVSDYSNYHKFEKMCHNQIDAICYVYGEEMKYVASLNEEDSEVRINVLSNEANNDARRITNKLASESESAAADLMSYFSSNMATLSEVLNNIVEVE